MKPLTLFAVLAALAAMAGCGADGTPLRPAVTGTPAAGLDPGTMTLGGGA